MTITIHLTPDKEALLERRANQNGVDVSSYAQQLLEERLQSEPMSGADIIRYWKENGLAATEATATDGPATARALRERHENEWRANLGLEPFAYEPLEGND